MKRLVSLAVLLGIVICVATPVSGVPAALAVSTNSVAAQSCDLSDPNVFVCCYPSYCVFDTGYYITGRIKQYWQQNGGLPVFGMAITDYSDEINPDNNQKYPTQWFERHRMEYHQENINKPPYDVLLGLLGKQQYNGNYSPSNPESPYLTGNCLDHAQIAGHSIPGIYNLTCGRFRVFWEGHRLLDPALSTYNQSLQLLGYPLSRIVDKNIGGYTYQVQYFERARLEWHGPDVGGPFGGNQLGPRGEWDVNGGLLGRELIGTRKPAPAFAPMPAREARQIQQIIGTKDLSKQDFAVNETALFGGGGGTALLLVPPLKSPGLSIDTLINKSAELTHLPLGGLHVVAQVDTKIPPDTYVLTLSGDAKNLILTSAAQAPIEIPAVVRELRVPLPRPLALITSYPSVPEQAQPFNAQLCLAWDVTQVCGLLNIPGMPTVSQKLFALIAAGELRINPDGLDFSQTISLVAGEEVLHECARSFYTDEPNYGVCPASVVAVPARADGAFDMPDGKEGVAIGLIEVQKDLREAVYLDSALTKLADRLPEGFYAVGELRSDTDLKLADGVTVGRVHLVGPTGDFYMPAVLGANFVGAARLSPLPEQVAPAVATGTSLFLRDSCIFKFAQCPFR